MDGPAGDKGEGPAPAWHDAAGEMARILDTPPLLVPAVFRDGARLTRRWRHGPVHDYMHPMAGYVLVAYSGAIEPISWRLSRHRLASRTRPRTFTVMPPGHDGRWDIEGDIAVSHVYLPDARLQQTAAEVSGGPVRLQERVAIEDATTARLMGILADEAASQDTAGRLFVEQAIDLLCIQLARAHSTAGAISLAPARGLAEWQVKRVADHMRDNLATDIGLAELAALVGLSRFHFCTAFRRATGLTPHRWLTAERIARAEALLADPARSVTDVAHAVGYATPSAFASAFRRATGTTPTAWRRRH